MAGIGFRLRRLAQEEGLLGFFASYAAAAAIMAGPWIITILTISCVTLLGGELERFGAYVTHAYQSSLIIAGFFQFPATRYLADLLYRHDYRKVFPAFNFTLIASLVASTLVGLLWAWSTPGPVPSVREKILVVSLQNIVNAQWIALVFLVTIHRYRSILFGFSLGGVASVLAATGVFGAHDSLTALLSFTLGQALALGILIGALAREYPAYSRLDLRALEWVWRSPALPLTGGFFYLGTFADKFAYRYGGWLSDDPIVGVEVVAPWLRISHPYEYLAFLAQLTVIPALAIFYIRVETGFYEIYKSFYETIDRRGTLQELTYLKEQLLLRLSSATRTVYASQGVITFLCVLVAPEIVPGRTLTPYESDILRANLLASFFAILLLLTLVIFLYFEFYREACTVAAGYALMNWSFCAVPLALGSDAHGWGAALASLVASLSAARWLWVKVDDLLFQTFSKSPVETLPLRAEHVPGVGRFHFVKGNLFE